MIASVLFAILISGQSPKHFTESQLRYIGCMAVIAIIAEEQRRNAPGSNDFPDVRKASLRWTSIVSDRIALESGQSAEAIELAIWAAVIAEQESVSMAPNPKAIVDDRMMTCLALMDAQIEIQPAS